MKKLKKSDARKIILENTDFFQNAKFAFGLAICYLLLEKGGFFASHFFLAVLVSILSLLSVKECFFLPPNVPNG